MAEKPDTTHGGAMPAEGHKTRRAALALFGAAPALAILPALAASPSAAVALAIGVHAAAQAEIDAMGPDPDEDAFDAACDLEAEALEAVAETPCDSDADFFVKAAYLIEREQKAWGTELSSCAQFGLLALALATELHMEARPCGSVSTSPSPSRSLPNR